MALQAVEAAEVKHEVVAGLQLQVAEPRHVTAPEVDFDTGPGCAAASFLEGSRYVLDARHVPSMRGHEHRLGAKPRTKVERASRREGGDHVGQLFGQHPVPGVETEPVHQSVRKAHVEIVAPVQLRAGVATYVVVVIVISAVLLRRRDVTN